MDAIRILAHTTFSLLSLLTFVSLTLAQPPPRSEVLRLPDDVAEKTEFLNPDYLLLTTPDLKASKDLLPIVIYLHGAGGGGVTTYVASRGSRGLSCARSRGSGTPPVSPRRSPVFKTLSCRRSRSLDTCRSRHFSSSAQGDSPYRCKPHLPDGK